MALASSKLSHFCPNATRNGAAQTKQPSVRKEAHQLGITHVPFDEASDLGAHAVAGVRQAAAKLIDARVHKSAGRATRIGTAARRCFALGDHRGDISDACAAV